MLGVDEARPGDDYVQHRGSRDPALAPEPIGSIAKEPETVGAAETVSAQNPGPGPVAVVWHGRARRGSGGIALPGVEPKLTPRRPSSSVEPGEEILFEGLYLGSIETAELYPADTLTPAEFDAVFNGLVDRVETDLPAGSVAEAAALADQKLSKRGAGPPAARGLHECVASPEGLSITAPDGAVTFQHIEGVLSLNYAISPGAQALLLVLARKLTEAGTVICCHRLLIRAAEVQPVIGTIEAGLRYTFQPPVK